MSVPRSKGHDRKRKPQRSGTYPRVCQTGRPHKVDESSRPRKVPKRLNVVNALRDIGKESVGGNLEPEEMADNLFPVLTHLMPNRDEQERWLNQMLKKLRMGSSNSVASRQPVSGRAVAVQTDNPARADTENLPPSDAPAAETPERRVSRRAPGRRASHRAVTPATETRERRVPRGAATPGRDEFCSLAPTLVTPRRKMADEELVDWDPNVMCCSMRDVQVPILPSQASRNRCRLRDNIKAAVTSAGCKSRQAVVIHDHCTRVDPALGQVLQMVEDPDRSRRVGEHVKHSIRNYLKLEAARSTSNEARSFLLTLFKSMVPAYPRRFASRKQRRAHSRKMKDFVKDMDLTHCQRNTAILASKIKRDMVDNPTVKVNLIESHQRKSPFNMKVTTELKHAFIEWAVSKSDTIVCSPDKKDMKIATDLETGKKIKDVARSTPQETVWVMQRKHKYKTSLTRLHKEAIQPVSEGGFDGFRDQNGKVWVGRTSFEKCTPDYFGRLTQSHKRGCECRDCLNGEYMMSDYVNWQKFSRRHQEKNIASLRAWIRDNPNHVDIVSKRRELGTRLRDLSDYLKDVFIETDAGTHSSEPRYTKLTDLVNKEMCCGLVNDTQLCPHACCLQKCGGGCQAFPRHRGEDHKLPPEPDEALINANWMMTFRFHETRFHCSTHGAFLNPDPDKQKECPICEQLPQKERPLTKPKKTEDPVKKTMPTHDFVTEFQTFINEKWRLHHWQVIGLNGRCKEFRKPELLAHEKHRLDCFIVRDYTDRMKCAHDRSTQSGEMGGAQRNIGMEGFYYTLYNTEKKKVEQHWFGFLSDEQQQDARTSLRNTDKFVKRMKKRNLLPVGSTLWMQSDGCTKQYKSGCCVATYNIIAQKYQLQVDYFVTTAGHGKCTVDSLAGTDKAYLNSGYLREMDPSRVDSNNRTISEAEKARKFLSDPGRALGDTKHGDAKVQSRGYDVSNYTEGDDIPLKHTNFVVTGFKREKKSGIKSHFHFRYHYKMKADEVFIRRVACLCPGCHENLMKPWEEGIETKLQPMFQNSETCYFNAMMGDLNKWTLCKVKHTKAYEVEEVNEIFQDALTYHTNEQMSKVKVGGFGAVGSQNPDAKKGFFLVKWKTLSYALQEETHVFGFGLMPPGTVVVEGQVYHHLPGNKCFGWFLPPEYTGPNMKHDIFWSQHVIRGDVIGKRSKPFGQDKHWPPSERGIPEYVQLFNSTGMFWVFPSQIDLIERDMATRDVFQEIGFDTNEDAALEVEAENQEEPEAPEPAQEEEDESDSSDQEYRPGR